MDHPCHKCGHSIEDGKAFCFQCGAPQIRVAVAEVVTLPVAVSGAEGAPPVLSLDRPEAATPLRVPALFGGIEWARAIRVCAVAALISVAMMSLRLIVPLVAVLGAGFLAVILYRYRNPTWKPNARSGTQLGAVTALLISGILAIFSAIMFAVLQSGGEIRQQVLDALQQLAARSTDQQVQEFLDLLKKPEGLAGKLILSTIGFLLISVAAGCIAGALTGAFLGRRNRS
jgi:hypothetical protein